MKYQLNNQVLLLPASLYSTANTHVTHVLAFKRHSSSWTDECLMAVTCLMNISMQAGHHVHDYMARSSVDHIQ